ncbi:MAG: NrsF family protein [Steroidobacteraceae bacterium]
METGNTDQLIDSLSQGLAPVRPLLPPARRALLWLAGFAVLTGLVLLRFADLAAFAARFAAPRMVLEAAAILLTGITSVVAAFYLSLPDRSSLWRYAPLPPLALWIATSTLGCLQYGLGLGPPGHRAGDSTHCFAFIIGVSVPLTVLLYAVLRRARPLELLPVALTGALGVAALAAFVLQFFHHFDVTAIDLATHMAAVLVVVGLAAASRRALA